MSPEAQQFDCKSTRAGKLLYPHTLGALILRNPRLMSWSGCFQQIIPQAARPDLFFPADLCLPSLKSFPLLPAHPVLSFLFSFFFFFFFFPPLSPQIHISQPFVQAWSSFPSLPFFLFSSPFLGFAEVWSKDWRGVTVSGARGW